LPSSLEANEAAELLPTDFVDDAFGSTVGVGGAIGAAGAGAD
jgi:hypothetical protein